MRKHYIGSGPRMSLRKGKSFKWTPEVKDELRALLKELKTWPRVTAAFNLKYATTYCDSALQRHVPDTKKTSTDPWEGQDEALELLHSYIGLEKAKVVANIINGRLGTNFTTGQIHRKVAKEKIKPAESQGDPTLMLVARELGISHDCVRNNLKKLKVKTYGHGVFTFVPQAGFEKLKTIYPQHKTPWISVAAASKELHVCTSVIWALITSKKLEAWRFGHLWRIDATSFARHRLNQRKIAATPMVKKKKPKFYHQTDDDINVSAIAKKFNIDSREVMVHVRLLGVQVFGRHTRLFVRKDSVPAIVNSYGKARLAYLNEMADRIEKTADRLLADHRPTEAGKRRACAEEKRQEGRDLLKKLRESARAYVPKPACPRPMAMAASGGD